MPRIFIILSLVPLVISLVARWYFGTRILFLERDHSCRLLHSHETETAVTLGRRWRRAAIKRWIIDHPRTAKKRQHALRFGLILPPLTLIACILSILAFKMSVLTGLAIFLLILTLAIVANWLTLPSEILAIQDKSSYLIDDQTKVKNIKDEPTILVCAIAHSWDDSVPPMLKLF